MGRFGRHRLHEEVSGNLFKTEFWDESEYIKISMMNRFLLKQNRLVARGLSVIFKISRLIICRNHLKLNAMLSVTARGQQIQNYSFVTFG